MNALQITTSAEVNTVFNSYPAPARKKLMSLRSLIIKTASETPTVTSLCETLKWGEPSYVTKQGSAIRIAWKPKAPHQYAMYFSCTSRLIPTFKRIYKNAFSFDGNRAIVFQLHEKAPITELKNCIATALTYHRVKRLPTLGM